MKKIRDRILGLERIQSDKLIPNPKNWRTHPAKQSAALRGLLGEVGIANAVIVRKVADGYQLIDGHLRRDVLKDQLIPALVIDLDDEEADKMLATLDPLASMAGRDNEMLAALLKSVSTTDPGIQRMLEDLGKTVGVLGESDPDEAVPPPTKSEIKLGQKFALGAHVLMCGDSTKDIPELLGNEKPNLMTTDPPYGVNYDPDWRNHVGLGNGHRRTGKVSNDDRADWTDVWKAFTGDVAYVWHGGLHSAEVERSLGVAGFEVRAQIIWAKTHAALSRGAYHWQHEPCWYAVRSGKKADWLGDRKQTTLWHVISTNGFVKGKDEDISADHSTQKPVELFRRPMINHTKPVDAVLDPFCGSGSCLIAAEQTGRRMFTIELDPLYVDQAITRWEKFTGKKAKKL